MGILIGGSLNCDGMSMSGFENSAGQFMSLVISSKYFPGLPEIELHIYLVNDIKSKLILTNSIFSSQISNSLDSYRFMEFF